MSFCLPGFIILRWNKIQFYISKHSCGCPGFSMASAARLSTKESFALALDALERAVEIDPDYAPAWAEIGSINLSKAFRTNSPEFYASARKMLEKSLAIDPGLAEAWANLSAIYSVKVTKNCDTHISSFFLQYQQAWLYQFPCSCRTRSMANGNWPGLYPGQWLEPNLKPSSCRVPGRHCRSAGIFPEWHAMDRPGFPGTARGTGH